MYQYLLSFGVNKDHSELRREAQLFTYPRLREASRLATVVSLVHTGVVGTGDLADCELTQGVNPGQERGLGVVLCKL